MILQQWFVLVLVTCIGIARLFLADAQDSNASLLIGLAVFTAASIYAFAFNKRHFDRIDVSN